MPSSVRAPLALVLLVLAGCIPIASAPTTPTPAELAGTTPVRLVNVTQRPICYVRFAPAGSPAFGEDWLGASETIPLGNYRDFGIRAGAYNFRVESCDGGVIQQQLGVDMTAAREIVIYEGAIPNVAETIGLVRLQYEAFPQMVVQPAQPAYAYAGGGATSYASQSDDASQPSSAYDEPAPSGPPATPTYSLSIHSDCDRTVGLFHGNGRPPFGSGTYGSISSNSTESFSGFVGSETFWITDDSRNGVSAFTPSAGSQSIEITAGCGGFAPR